ncbi:hypothetical protein POM88_034004 [Heracleum sosnowskyi]|uniref:Uncharacterized protein n=1 Tax=Heracleum sosnowskyi TaxID=360622 RepID=A0AAD8HIF8_9APIA|nr:hypothetical protein POM88_034004 [Heracleum sosnowskyi]
MLACILTKSFFEIYSGFGHPIKIYAPQSACQELFSLSTDSRLKVFLDLPSNLSHNFLAMILCYKDFRSYKPEYSVRTSTKKYDWNLDEFQSCFLFSDEYNSCIEIVPKSIFSVTSGDEKIEFTNFGARAAGILGIHLLYKMEITVIDECDSTTVNGDKERKHFPEWWKNLRNDIDWLSSDIRTRLDYFERRGLYCSRLRYEIDKNKSQADVINEIVKRALDEQIENNVGAQHGSAEINGLEGLTSIQELCLGGCNSSLLKSTLTKRFFQIYSGFGHQITIYAPLSVSPDWVDQDWISRTSNYASTVSSDLPPDVSPNFMAMILCCKHMDFFHHANYSVKTNTNVFEWIGMPQIETFSTDLSYMIIVPRTVFSVTDSDDRIEFTVLSVTDSDDRIEITALPHWLKDEENVEILGIHLLYKSDVTLIDECDSTTINVDEEKVHSSKRLKHV